MLDLIRRKINKFKNGNQPLQPSKVDGQVLQAEREPIIQNEPVTLIPTTPNKTPQEQVDNGFKRPTVGLVTKNPRFGRISNLMGRGK